jgi:DNA-binding MarR family transcriptional regulator
MSDPAAIATLTGPLKATYDDLFMASLRPVFQTAAGVAFVAFLLSFAIKEVPLRTTLTTEPSNDPLQMPRDATSLKELELIVSRITAKENRWRVYEQAAKRLGVDLQPDELWLLARMGEMGGPANKDELRNRLGPTEARLPRPFGRLEAAGMAREAPTGFAELTDSGRDVYARLLRQREGNLATMLADWNRNEHPEVRALMKELAKSFASSPPVKPATTTSTSIAR